MNFRAPRNLAICSQILGIFVFSQVAMATSVTFVGFEEGSAANGYSVQNWSTSVVPENSAANPKAFDLGGLEKYGTAGYYMIRPSQGEQFAEGVGVSNDLGTSASTFPTLYSKPAFLGTNNIFGGPGTYVNFSGYSVYRGPDGTSLRQIGGLSVPVNQGPYNTPSGDNTGYFGEAFSFTTQIAATFRVGIAVDSVASGTYAPDYVSLYSPNTGTVHSALLARNGSPDLAVFEVDAGAGELFAAAVWQLAGNLGSVAPFSLVTFDVIRYNFDVPAGQNQSCSLGLNGAPSALLKTGDGTLVLSGSNTYGGGTTISAGTLRLQGGSLMGNITNNANLTITGGMELLNTVSGSGSLTKADPGLSILWSANSYTGATVVEAGSLRLDGAGSLSGSTILQVASGALFSATGVFKTSNDLTIAGLTGAGEVFSKAGTLTVNKSSGTDTFEGSISGDQGLVKSGGGSLILAGASSYTGSTSIDTGRLVLAHRNALGSTSAGTVVASGAQLRLNPLADTEFAAEPLTISGEGLTGTVGGALRNATNNNTWKGKISLAANASIGAASGTTLTLDVDSGDAIDLAGFDLVFDGAGMVQINDPIAGTGQISKIGSGQLVVSNSDLTATIRSNSVSVNFAVPPTDGTFAILSGPLDAFSLATATVTGLGAGKTATVANSPNLVVQVTEMPTGPTFESAYPANALTDVAPNGLTYLMNYAFGGSSTNNAKLPAQETSDPSLLTLVAYVRTNDPSVTVAPERGSSLTSWTSDSITTNILTDPYAPAGTEKRSYSTPINTNSPRMFLRLKATRNP